MAAARSPRTPPPLALDAGALLGGQGGPSLDILPSAFLTGTEGGGVSVADLLGIPHRLVLAERTLEQGQVEYKARRASEPELLPFDAAVEWLERRRRR